MEQQKEQLIRHLQKIIDSELPYSPAGFLQKLGARKAIEILYNKGFIRDGRVSLLRTIKDVKEK